MGAIERQVFNELNSGRTGRVQYQVFLHYDHDLSEVPSHVVIAAHGDNGFKVVDSYFNSAHTQMNQVREVGE
jgi:hypothetical protein